MSCATPDAPRGCGAPALRIAFRGSTRRLFLCSACTYEGRGQVKPYETDVAGKPKTAGAYSGPARRCGEEIGG